uniref:DUF7083 domain-containing protein n=1 Tax=Meloidogyne enterolobii TaxID=390850 RepID=A0A6V7WGR3_MELEN|nr:unnamed protein product [Meloidogyne enterolobii]
MQTQIQMLEMMKGKKVGGATDLYCKLKTLITEFQADVEKGVTFESWYLKNKSYFEVDAKSLDEKVKVRLLVDKLGQVEYSKMAQKCQNEN